MSLTRCAFGAGLLCSTLALVSTGAAQISQDDWRRADEATARLPPSTFSVPPSIRAAMERFGCTVPQPAGATRPGNVISGHFTQPDRTDWAVLCSRANQSKVLVFHGNDASELGDAADVGYLQSQAGGRIGFSRRLSVATPEAVRRAANNNQPQLRVIDHDGVVDAFEGKGATIWYWSEGKWIQLPGAD